MVTTVPRVEFIASTAPEMPDCFVSIVGPDAPTMVAIHGISRNAAEIATRFSQHPAFAGVNVIAPLFDAARFGKYQQLRTLKEGQTASDVALFCLLDHLAAQHGINTGKVAVFGFSGGAQMAHRLAILRPSRIRAVCAAAAGWYLLPVLDLPYPYGLGQGCPAAWDRDATLRIPMTVIVGSRDTRVDESVRQDRLIVAHQGTNRLRRARIWTQVMRKHAAQCEDSESISLITLENGSHDFGQCARETELLNFVSAALHF
ncbi:MAG: hypothetical protein B7Y36_08960 [Novosphingobium sp. 28-62-57]|uniref:alpha/beta fold hydrolase n=1 Tax=unclassified Novosphingobium TaxID=2644732 RepID=UPI000BD0580F|nr:MULTISPECIES: alpha/beta hydrolase [unclassified Novosphingobium]OYW51268.1 MAG: hypothetical protein B7Z34_00170 [Novosphingobium sp. 12-62-10]OYZ10351.1 MAG: hypothetical protein B7Y36_08960 [Novosphingobium sp. 28-62-57]OZA37201.1 MAG: hypothetical protein B7X92_05160 [Novosphingobium sp. 17-62-9]HQS68070.1 alpha/beta hydrolase [Novosphingobium sp.]